MSNLAISMGNYWQGMVAERMGYAQVLYLDALIALLVIGLIPFLRGREEPVEQEAPVPANAVLVPAAAGD
jgi:predicted MFS family arabinose efflux permease